MKTPFKMWSKKLTLELYRTTFGMRRFGMLDWWRAKCGIKPKSPRPIAYSSGREAYLIMLKTQKEAQEFLRSRMEPVHKKFWDGKLAEVWRKDTDERS